MRVLEFMFYKVYHFYNRRWPGKDAEIYAMCFVAIWLYFITLFFALILFNLTGVDLLNSSQRWWIILPGLVFLVAGWTVWLNHDQYKRITTNKRFSLLERTQKGKLYMTLLVLLPCLFLVIALITKRTS
jgi:hypothetical protein